MKSGRFNKRKHELYDLCVNPSEALVVKLIFDKYTNEGYGTHRITTWLNEQGYRARTGKPWHAASIRGILNNLTYTGILRSGEARSEIFSSLQIISPEQFARAAEIMQARSGHWKEQNTVPLNTKGQSLLAGKAYCGHCGAKLTLTTSGRGRQRKDGTVDNTRRVRYACYGKTRKQTECDGQTGYTMHILDDLIDEIVRGIFTKMRGVSKEDMIRLRYANELEIRKARLIVLNADYTKAVDNLQVLKGEVVNAIKGESSFSPEMLSGLIAEAEKECNRLAALCAQAEKDVTDSEQLLKEVAACYDMMVSWAELYETASFEKKKMIVNCFINRVDVYRGYKLHIDFNFDYRQFVEGLDCIEAA